jgi:hypothetical protein
MTKKWTGLSKLYSVTFLDIPTPFAILALVLEEC